MAIKVNLLPVEKRVGKGLQRILRVTRMLGVISLGAFIIFGLGLVAFFIFNSVQLNDFNTTNASLEGKIAGLETSETKLALLKDRVAKIKVLTNIPTALHNLDSTNSILAPLTADSNVNELSANSAKVSLSLNFRSTGDIANFLKALSETREFQTVSLTSFSFNPTSGYLVSVAIGGK